jgi:hypothetical protein
MGCGNPALHPDHSGAQVRDMVPSGAPSNTGQTQGHRQRHCRRCASTATALPTSLLFVFFLCDSFRSYRPSIRTMVEGTARSSSRQYALHCTHILSSHLTSHQMLHDHLSSYSLRGLSVVTLPHSHSQCVRPCLSNCYPL